MVTNINPSTGSGLILSETEGLKSSQKVHTPRDTINVLLDKANSLRR